VSRIRPDIVDAHYISINGYLAAVSGFHPAVLTAWGSDVLVNPKQNLLYRLLFKRAIAKADYILCSSPAVKEEIVRLGATSDKAEIVFIGTNVGEFSLAQRDTMLMQRLDIPVASPVVISVRGFKPVYDVETLIKAIPLILEEVPQTRFIIAGQGDQKEYLEKLTQGYDVHDRVRFVGWISHNELPVYLASSDIYVSTSLSDGTSVSLLEAMACGLAPVVSGITANQAWIKDGVNGFLFPTRDYEALAKSIVCLINDKKKRKKFGAASRRIAQEKAGFEKQISEVEELYQRLVVRASYKSNKMSGRSI